MASNPAARPAPWLICLASAAVILLVALSTSRSDARSADIKLNVSGDQEFAKELRELVEEAEKQQPSASDAMTLLQGVQARRQRVNQALRSRGYYGAEIGVTVAGRPFDDPDLLAAVESRLEGDKLPVVLDVKTGPAYRIGGINLHSAAPDSSLPPLDRTKLALAPGKQADTKGILAVEEQILTQTRQHGYALATIAERQVVVDHASQELHVSFTVATGPLARMGRVHFTGTEKVDTAFLQGRVPFSPGETYDPAKVRRLSDRLTSLGVFNQVRVVPATRLDENAELPFEVELRDRPPRTIGFGAAYETQLGFSANAFWLHRNLFGEAESLRISAEINRLAQGPIEDIGFMFRTALRKPDWWLPQQDALVEAEVGREIFDAYRWRGVRLNLGLERALSPKLRVKAGIAAEYSLIVRQGVEQDYQLIGLPLGVTVDESNNELDPTSGWRALAALTPYVDLGATGEPFAILRTTGSAYFDIAGFMGWQHVGRSVVAVRGSFGTIPGVRTGAIPPDKLFYAGGGGSVRGFAYQSAGPRDAFNKPLGGASLVEANLEFRQRISDSFGVVAFLDAGSAYEKVLPDFTLAPRVGAGLGVRYYTGFGPLRLDAAIPLNKRQGDADFGIYVSLGQAF